MARKVIQRSLGGPEVLEIVDVPQPNPDDLRAGEVLVRVAAAGLNVVDRKARAGVGGPPMGDLPFTVGWDLAGTVEAVAPDVTEFQPSDRVFGMSRFPAPAAAYAQFAVTAANDLVATPATMTDESAAALPLAALTAWQGLTDAASVQPGQRVLIQGAGGVGHLAVQMAHNLGASIAVTGDPGKREWLRSLGVDQFVDYTSEDFAEVLSGDPVDIVLDFVGGKVGVNSVKVIRKGGLLLQFNDGMDPAAQAAADAAGIRIDGPAVHTDKQQLTDIAHQAGTGELTVTIVEVYDLDNIGDAHRALDRGHLAGKLVIRT